MSGICPPTCHVHIPVELSDVIIDYALDDSPTAHVDAQSISLSHPQLRTCAQGVLVEDIYISHRTRRRNPLRFFTHAPHLILYVHTICLCGDKDQWQDQFPMIITMLSRGEGWTTRIVLEHVTIRELLEVGANWEPFFGCDDQWLHPLLHLLLSMDQGTPKSQNPNISPCASQPLLLQCSSIVTDTNPMSRCILVPSWGQHH